MAITTYANAILWPNLQLMQLVPLGGQILLLESKNSKSTKIPKMAGLTLSGQDVPNLAALVYNGPFLTPTENLCVSTRKEISKFAGLAVLFL